MKRLNVAIVIVGILVTLNGCAIYGGPYPYSAYPAYGVYAPQGGIYGYYGYRPRFHGGYGGGYGWRGDGWRGHGWGGRGWR